MSEPVLTNGNGDKVPMSVLDRFLTLSKENSDAYGSMVTALDQMSSTMMGFVDRIESVESTIKKEQLGKVVTDAVTEIKSQAQVMQSCVGVLGHPQYNVLKALGEYLQFTRATDEDLQKLVKDALFFFTAVNFFRRNKTWLSFVLGVTLVSLLGSTGMGAWDLVQLLMSKGQ